MIALCRTDHDHRMCALCQAPLRHAHKHLMSAFEGKADIDRDGLDSPKVGASFLPDAQRTRACAHKHLMSAFEGKADIDRDVPRWYLRQCADSVVMIGAT